MKYYKDNISVVILDVYHYVGKDKKYLKGWIINNEYHNQKQSCPFR